MENSQTENKECSLQKRLLKAKILRKSRKCRGIWLLVSRSFDSQQSWKEANTQKGADRKNLGREDSKKRGAKPHLSIWRKMRPEMAKKWFIVLPRPCSQTELVYTVLQSDTPKQA